MLEWLWVILGKIEQDYQYAIFWWEKEAHDNCARSMNTKFKATVSANADNRMDDVFLFKVPWLPVPMIQRWYWFSFSFLRIWFAQSHVQARVDVVRRPACLISSLLFGLGGVLRHAVTAACRTLSRMDKPPFSGVVRAPSQTNTIREFYLSLSDTRVTT